MNNKATLASEGPAGASSSSEESAEGKGEEGAMMASDARYKL